MTEIILSLIFHHEVIDHHEMKYIFHSYHFWILFCHRTPSLSVVDFCFKLEIKLITQLQITITVLKENYHN